MRRLVLIAALCLIGCADTPPTSAPSVGLPAPTPKDVRVHVGRAQAGRTVTVQVSSKFAVELIGTPTAGYVWAPSQTPDFITKIDEATGPTMSAQREPGFTGGTHWEVTIFSADRPGEGELKFEQRRPWETNQPPADTFSVTIQAR